MTIPPAIKPPRGPCLTPRRAGSRRKGVGFDESPPESCGARRALNPASKRNRLANQIENARTPRAGAKMGVLGIAGKVRADIDERGDKGEFILLLRVSPRTGFLS